MSIRTFSRSLLILAAFLGSLSVAAGQNATVTGTVTDPSDALVRGASIELKNVENGVVFSTISTETGNYTIPNVPVGAYELQASAAGFKTYLRRGLTFSAQQAARVDVALEVGAPAEFVTVTEVTPLLKTENGELAHNVTIEQWNTLPILQLGGAGEFNTSGYRDPYALARMIPGIIYVPNLTMIVNGLPDDTVQFRIDGQTAQNTGLGRQYTAFGQPSAEAIQEVAVQTSNYAAEFGTAGGAVFNVTMKSGTNRFHGSLYDYAANEVLNAHQPYTGFRSPVRRHNYGFSIGGPVSIPNRYDGTNRTFFFGSWERYREDITVRTGSATVPTAEYRAGDFQPLIQTGGSQLLRTAAGPYLDPLGRTILSGTIFDPRSTQSVVCPPSGATCSATSAGAAIATRDAFPNNAIPVSRFDPVALRVLDLVPLPFGRNAESGSAFQNYQRPYATNTRSQIPSIKLNHVVNDRNRMDFYYQRTGVEAPQAGNPDGLPGPITGARGFFVYTDTYRLNWDYTLTPTMLFHAGAGWYRNDFSDRAPVIGYDAEAELGLRGGTLKRNFPNISVGAVPLYGGMNNLGPFFGLQSTAGSERRPSGNVQVSAVRGNHTIKLGGEWRGERYPVTTYGSSSGAYTFLNASQQPATQIGAQIQAPGFTGFNFASFLLGDASQVSLSAPASTQIGKQQWSLYAQDAWRLSRRLTVDYGLRWDYGTYARERWGRNANFSPTTPNPSAGGHPGAQIFEATCHCRFADNYPYALGPRLGVAYLLTARTVLRAGIGIVYAPTGVISGQAASSSTLNAVGFDYFPLRDGIPATLQPRFPVFEPNVGHPPGTIVAAPAFLDPNAGRPARQYQWSAGLQRQIGRDLVVEASYVANRGMWWPAPALAGANLISEPLLRHYGFEIGNAADGTMLSTAMGQLTVGQRSVLASRGVFVPYSGFPASALLRNSLLPFPQYSGPLQPQSAPLGKTWYDSLQVTANRRYAHGLTLNANYTLSKTLDLMNSPDVFNRSLGKNLAGSDIPQMLRVTFEYVVPRLRDANRLVSLLLADWGIAWNLQYQSGAMLALPTSQSPQPISQWLGRGPGPAQYVQGQSLWSTNWVDYDGKVHTDPIDINCHCFDPTKNVVLNPAAWANVPDGQWAANMSSIREYRNIRQPSENANLSRNFRFKERFNLNVRVEFQNVFNRTRLSLAGAALSGFQAAPTTVPSGPNRGLYSAGFGTIVPLSGTPGARSGLFVGRLTF